MKKDTDIAFSYLSYTKCLCVVADIISAVTLDLHTL